LRADAGGPIAPLVCEVEPRGEVVEEREREGEEEGAAPALLRTLEVVFIVAEDGAEEERVRGRRLFIVFCKVSV
jgi:hypothetical protein